MRTARTASPERPQRVVYVHSPYCGHRWPIRTMRTDEQIESGRVECPFCRQVSRRTDWKRTVRIMHSGRVCSMPGCGNALALHHVKSDVCGPCEERVQRQITRMAEPAWRLHLAEQRCAVLSLLPGTFPALVVKIGLARRNAPGDPVWRLVGADVQRILGAAIKAGEVVQWNPPDGGRPVYRLVGDAS